MVVTTDSQSSIYALLNMLHNPAGAGSNKHLEMNMRTVMTLLSFSMSTVKAHQGEHGNEAADKLAKAAALRAQVGLTPSKCAKLRAELARETANLGLPDLLQSATLLVHTRCLTAHRPPYTIRAGLHAFDTRKHMSAHLLASFVAEIFAAKTTITAPRMNVRHAREGYHCQTHVRPLLPQSHASMLPSGYNAKPLRTALSMTYNSRHAHLINKPCPLPGCTDLFSAAHLLLSCKNLTVSKLIATRHDNALVTIAGCLSRHSRGGAS